VWADFGLRRAARKAVAERERPVPENAGRRPTGDGLIEVHCSWERRTILQSLRPVGRGKPLVAVRPLAAVRQKQL
jgi:hypothetical protein